MGPQSEAQLPYRARARGAWLLWMAGGLVAGYVVLTAVMSIEIWAAAASEILAGSDLAYFVVLLINLIVLGAAIVTAGRFARNRLLMPGEVWLALLAAPVVLGLVVPLVTGDLTLLRFAALTAALIGVGWMFGRTRPSRQETPSVEERLPV